MPCQPCHGGTRKQGTQVWWTRILKKVVDHHLFLKQCFFVENFIKWWYLAILALFLVFHVYQFQFWCHCCVFWFRKPYLCETCNWFTVIKFWFCNSLLAFDSKSVHFVNLWYHDFVSLIYIAMPWSKVDYTKVTKRNTLHLTWIRWWSQSKCFICISR